MGLLKFILFIMFFPWSILYVIVRAVNRRVERERADERR